MPIPFIYSVQCHHVICFQFQFRFYGEEVVKAAIEAKTHYLDICGEPMVSCFNGSSIRDLICFTFSLL